MNIKDMTLEQFAKTVLAKQQEIGMIPMGVEVGEIELDPADPGRIIVRLRLPVDTIECSLMLDPREKKDVVPEMQKPENPGSHKR